MTKQNAIREYLDVLTADLKKVSRSQAHKAAAIDRLLTRARKKARVQSDDARLHKEAVENFLVLNGSLKGFKHTLPANAVFYAREFIEHALHSFTKSVDEDEVLSLSYVKLLDFWRFGPGASNGVTGTHTASKITQPMTVTSAASFDVRQLRGSNAYFSTYDSGAYANGHVVIEGSRITSVPKNEDTKRTIAIEPSGNMAMQLAAGRYLEEALKRVGLDITCQQELNKLLAREASVDGTMCTIDLKNASDRITPDLVRALFPNEWVSLFMRLRSPVAEIPGYGSYELYMVSTMGNGFTFPLMTLIIVSLLYAMRALNGSGHPRRLSWAYAAVFGDDIICRSSEYESMCDLLSRAGFVINHDKSFASGPFRESCGGDYWDGYDVTPFYPKSLASDSEVYVVINQQLAWMVRHNIVLPSSLDFLVKLIGRPFLVPEWMNPDQGILTASVNRRYKYLLPQASYMRCPEIGHFNMMLACGGYITASGPHSVFSPRPKQARYAVRSARLPKGWSSGWDPRKRSRSDSQAISFILEMILN